MTFSMMTLKEQVNWNKINLLLKNPLQYRQTLQLFTIITKTESIQKVIKMPSCKAWGEERPSILIKRGGEGQELKTRL